MIILSGSACTATTLLNEYVASKHFSEKVLGYVLADYLQV